MRVLKAFVHEKRPRALSLILADRGVWTQPTWTSHEDWADLVLHGRWLRELLLILDSGLCMLLQRIEEAFVVFQERVELLPCQGIGLLAHDAQAWISPALNEAPLVEGLLGHSRHA